MFENLNQPYPFHNNFKHNLRTISFVSMGFMLVVLYFQPFGINFLASPRNGYFVLIMGLISAATFFLSTLIIPGFFPKLFESSRWTIRKELIWNTCMFVVLVAGFALGAMIFKINSFQSLSLFRSGALALLPIILFNLLNYNTSLKTKVVQMIDSGRHWLAEERKGAHNTGKDDVILSSENGKEIYEGGIDNIIVIQSASNYVEIYYRDGLNIRKQLIRQTLSTVEKLMASEPNIQKCHRCALVNIDQVKKLSGSSPNVTIEIDGLDFRIPVSRQRTSYFRKLIGSR
ncbi:MAG: LytTR family transcriptional regulator [Bacteroidetes bacterium]|nr:LytTR family transcriptional regulator [Bacteroidota bacterium]